MNGSRFWAGLSRLGVLTRGLCGWGGELQVPKNPGNLFEQVRCSGHGAELCLGSVMAHGPDAYCLN